MTLKNFPVSLQQARKLFCKEYLAYDLKSYFPMISSEDILPGPSCVQSQVIEENGDFVDNFLIEFFEGEGIRKRIVNCKFIPSPGATSCLAIGKMVTDEMAKKFQN